MQYSRPPEAPAGGKDLGLVSPRLIKLIEDHADELTRKWLKIVRSHPDTPTYHTYDENKLYERAFSVYGQLSKWLSANTTKGEVEHLYTELGAQRRREGFSLSEVLQALIVTRRVLWFKVESDGLMDTAIDLNLGLQLNNHVVLFFDRAMFFIAQGYESAGT